MPRAKCPVGFKPVSACPSDLQAGPTPHGDLLPRPTPEHYGLGASVSGRGLQLGSRDVTVIGPNLKKLNPLQVSFWVPASPDFKKRVFATFTADSYGPYGDPMGLVDHESRASSDEIRKALMEGHDSFSMRLIAVSSGSSSLQNQPVAIQLTPAGAEAMLVWLDGLEEKGLAGLGEMHTPKCAYGEVPVCTPRHKVPGLSGLSDLRDESRDLRDESRDVTYPTLPE